jgi:hypothetical protein
MHVKESPKFRRCRRLYIEYARHTNWSLRFHLAGLQFDSENAGLVSDSFDNWQSIAKINLEDYCQLRLHAKKQAITNLLSGISSQIHCNSGSTSANSGWLSAYTFKRFGFNLKHRHEMAREASQPFPHFLADLPVKATRHFQILTLHPHIVFAQPQLGQGSISGSAKSMSKSYSLIAIKQVEGIRRERSTAATMATCAIAMNILSLNPNASFCCPTATFIGFAIACLASSRSKTLGRPET